MLTYIFSICTIFGSLALRDRLGAGAVGLVLAYSLQVSLTQTRLQLKLVVVKMQFSSVDWTAG